MQLLLQWKSNEYYTTCMCICSLSYPACNVRAPYCHLWPAPLYNIFPHYLINGTILEEKKSTGYKMRVFIVSTTIFAWNIFHSKKKKSRYNKNIYWSSCKVLFNLV